MPPTPPARNVLVPGCRLKPVIVATGFICVLSLSLLRNTFQPQGPLQAIQIGMNVARSGASFEPSHAAVIRKHAGLYADKAAHPEYYSTVLVTFADPDTAELLRNWQCSAGRFGLDWVVMMGRGAPDRPVPPDLVGERIVPVGGAAATESMMPRSCMRMALVAQVMRETGLDVVVSDVGNVLRADPFRRGVSLGDMIRSMKFDYIYLQDRRSAPNDDPSDREGTAASTGFYFVSSSRKQHKMHTLLDAAQAECKHNPHVSNRTNLLHSLVLLQRDSVKQFYATSGFRCSRLCGTSSSCSGPDQDLLEYCDMDPRSHVSGWDAGARAGRVVSYDVDSSASVAAKVDALRTARLWGFFDTGARQCTPTDVAAAARDCLRMTAPSLDVSYPLDAERHFEDIQRFLAPWRENIKPHCGAGFCGPWIENIWISHFEGLWHNRDRGAALHDIFGPYVPLFFPWVDLWVKSFHYPPNFTSQLKAHLRPDVPYITVSQNDEGLTGKCELLMSSIPNLLVLSAGGYGHAAIPLFKQPEHLNNAKPMAARSNLVSYMGSPDHGPVNVRKRMQLIVSAKSAELGFASKVGKSDVWKAVMADSRASLCPRGFGRTAYHVVETIHMGLVPVYVYTDTPWVPYPELFESFGFVTDLIGLPAVLERLHKMSVSELEHMERRIVKLKASHFSTGGVMEQIGRFMTARDGGGDLSCRALPPDVRGMGPCTCEGHAWCGPNE